MIVECAKQNKPVPIKYLSPLLLDGVDWLLDIFWELSTDRAMGFGCVGLIPRASIADELDRWGITDPDDRDHIRRCIRQADAAYVRYMHRQAGTPGTDKRSSAATLASPPVNAPKLTPLIMDALFGGVGESKQRERAARHRAVRRRGGQPKGGE